MKTKRLLVIAFLAVISPCIAWYAYKPVRVFFPEWAGLTCLTETLCLENPDQLSLAEGLYADAQAFVQQHVAVFHQYPRFIFCETQACFEYFGFKKARAQSIGTIATVIGPRAWLPHIIRHEMIHHIQNEQLGTLTFVSMPIWFVEGMAYSLSEDPRQPLSEPWESYRTEFKQWYRRIKAEELWSEAKHL